MYIDRDYYKQAEYAARQPQPLSRRTHAARRVYMASHSTSFDREQFDSKANGARRKSADNNGFQSKVVRKQNPIIAFMRRKSFVWFLLTAGCITGLVLQLEDIIELYFEYETVSELSIDVPTNIIAPEIMNRHELHALFPHTKNETIIMLSDVQHLTLADMFKMVPMPAGLLMSCIYRAPYSYARFAGDEQCEDVFQIERYFKQQYVCYLFRMREMEKAEFAFDYIQNSMRNPGTFYELMLDDNILNVTDTIQITVHSPELKPRGISAFPVIVARSVTKIDLKGNEDFDPDDDSTNEHQTPLIDSSFTLTYATIGLHLLKYPYSTDCLNYEDVEFESQGDCVDKCQAAKLVDLINKQFFGSVATRSSELEILSQEELENSTGTLVKDLWDINQACWQTCSKPNCNNMIYMTKFIRSEQSDPTFYLLKFRLYVANEPIVITQVKAKLLLTEFLIYILSCFGIWLGMSFYSLAKLIESGGSSAYNWCLQRIDESAAKRRASRTDSEDE